MGIKELLLQKGWAGRTISREETIERLNPITRIMTELMHTYGAVRGRVDASERDAFESELKTLRADIGKMAETIFSCGGTPFNGTELEAGDFEVDSDSDAWKAIRDAEQVLGDALREEKNIEHQMRTRAILGKVAENHENRLKLLRSHA